jgi:hypothetical protein
MFPSIRILGCLGLHHSIITYGHIMINQQYLQSVQGQLAQFAAQDNFESIIFTAFGDRIDLLLLQDLRQQWLTGDFSVIPEIQVLENGELGGANGAYAAELNRIFVSADFLATAGERSIGAVLLEEVGHRIDQLLNGDLDSAGDEGEIFSRLVNGADLSLDVLTDLRAQNDRGVIVVEGRSVSVENQVFYGNNVTGTDESDNIFGSSPDPGVLTIDSNDFLDGAEGDDIIEGYNGNDTLYGGVAMI